MRSLPNTTAARQEPETSTEAKKPWHPPVLRVFSARDAKLGPTGTADGTVSFS